MRHIQKFLIFICALLAFAVDGTAQDATPLAQFDAAVATFQKSATEANARALAAAIKQLDQPPAVPETAEFHALKGAAFVKQASDAFGFGKASTEFRAAIAAAPWVEEYHYNLVICEKSADHFSEALSALGFAQLFSRDDKERHDCLALRAEIEAGQELGTEKKANKEKEEALTKNEKEEAVAKSIEALAKKDHEEFMEFLRRNEGAVYHLDGNIYFAMMIEKGALYELYYLNDSMIAAGTPNSKKINAKLDNFTSRPPDSDKVKNASLTLSRDGKSLIYDYCITTGTIESGTHVVSTYLRRR